MKGRNTEKYVSETCMWASHEFTASVYILAVIHEFTTTIYYISNNTSMHLLFRLTCTEETRKNSRNILTTYRHQNTDYYKFL